MDLLDDSLDSRDDLNLIRMMCSSFFVVLLVFVIVHIGPLAVAYRYVHRLPGSSPAEFSSLFCYPPALFMSKVVRLRLTTDLSAHIFST